MNQAKQKAGEQLVAAANPGDFIDEWMIDEFIAAAGISWEEGYGLVTRLYGELPIPLYASTVSNGIKTAAAEYNSLLQKLLSGNIYGLKGPVFGEFIRGTEVQYGDVRPLLVHIGGGSPEAFVETAGGITSGTTMREFLRSNGIDTNKKIWLYGYEDEPRRTFNGHLQMDGLVFEEWDDDGLLISPQDAWLRRDHYAPGDHFGCACVVAPYVPNFGPDFQVEISD